MDKVLAIREHHIDMQKHILWRIGVSSVRDQRIITAKVAAMTALSFPTPLPPFAGARVNQPANLFIRSFDSGCRYLCVCVCVSVCVWKNRSERAG
jgi:hypothetical protein